MWKAFFLGELVYVDGRSCKSNETLTACLNLPEGELNDCLVGLWRLAPSARLSGASAERLRSFLGCMQRAQELFRRIDALAEELPIFRGGEGGGSEPLSMAALLDRFRADGGGGGVEDDCDFINLYFLPVAATLSRLSGAEAARELDRLNRGVAGLFDRYIGLTADILEARRVYSVLLDKYIHEKRAYLSNQELAECFSRYRRDSARLGKRDRLPEGLALKGAYEVFADGEGRERFALCCCFERLRDFLYVDFFRGLERSHLPRRCDGCGRYFLLAGGKYSGYCTLPLPGEPQKTCRSVGARQRYGSKCKTDPVWLVYNRAYKAHYARYMKGKMSAAEFERWSRYAVSLREQAADGTLGAEQYERMIKE